MKEGDKIYCIKDMIREASKIVDVTWTITDKSGKRKEKRNCCDECKDGLTNCWYLPKKKFTFGKSYTIKNLGYGRYIAIEDDFGNVVDFMPIKYYRDYNEPYVYIFDEYFIDGQEYRKKKLEELKDINFNNFLKNLKK